MLLIIHGRETAGRDTQTYPNILDDRYLDAIEALEDDVARNVAFAMRARWRTNATAHIRDIVRFEDICLNWNGEVGRFYRTFSNFMIIFSVLSTNEPHFNC